MRLHIEIEAAHKKWAALKWSIAKTTFTYITREARLVNQRDCIDHFFPTSKNQHNNHGVTAAAKQKSRALVDHSFGPIFRILRNYVRRATDCKMCEEEDADPYESGVIASPVRLKEECGLTTTNQQLLLAAGDKNRGKLLCAQSMDNDNVEQGYILNDEAASVQLLTEMYLNNDFYPTVRNPIHRAWNALYRKSKNHSVESSPTKNKDKSKDERKDALREEEQWTWQQLQGTYKHPGRLTDPVVIGKCAAELCRASTKKGWEYLWYGYYPSDYGAYFENPLSKINAEGCTSKELKLKLGVQTYKALCTQDAPELRVLRQMSTMVRGVFWELHEHLTSGEVKTLAFDQERVKSMLVGKLDSIVQKVYTKVSVNWLECKDDAVEEAVDQLTGFMIQMCGGKSYDNVDPEDKSVILMFGLCDMLLAMNIYPRYKHRWSQNGFKTPMSLLPATAKVPQSCNLVVNLLNDFIWMCNNKTQALTMSREFTYRNKFVWPLTLRPKATELSERPGCFQDLFEVASHMADWSELSFITYHMCFNSVLNRLAKMWQTSTLERKEWRWAIAQTPKALKFLAVRVPLYVAIAMYMGCKHTMALDTLLRFEDYVVAVVINDECESMSTMHEMICNDEARSRFYCIMGAFLHKMQVPLLWEHEHHPSDPDNYMPDEWPQWWVRIVDTPETTFWSMYHIASMLLANKLICFTTLSHVMGEKLRDKYSQIFGEWCLDIGMYVVQL